MCQDAPDTSGMNAAAESSAAISKEALDWYKGEAARTQGARDEAQATQTEVSKGQLATMQQQSEIAAGLEDYRKNTFQPLEQQIVDEAKAYASPGRVEAAADTARADVQAAQAGAVSATTRSLARMGYDPTVQATKQAATQALAEAGAATGARRITEATGRAMRSDAANMGRGLSSAQATTIATGTGAGGAASGAAGASMQTAGGAAALMGQGYGIGLQGQGQAGSLYGQQASIQQEASASQGSMIGSLAGGAMAMF